MFISKLLQLEKSSGQLITFGKLQNNNFYTNQNANIDKLI